MILVNNPGSWDHVYPPLRHAAWHGWTPTDLVFPSFLFIVGVAIPLALGKRLERGDSPSARSWRRSSGGRSSSSPLGLFMNAFPFDKPLSGLRIPGVLQRIALCYLAASLLYLKTALRVQVLTTVRTAARLLGGDDARAGAGLGAGDLSRPNNLAAWVDRGLLPGHLYKSDYDPEGLLSTLPAIATTLIGVLTGRWLATARPIEERVAGHLRGGRRPDVRGLGLGCGLPGQQGALDQLIRSADGRALAPGAGPLRVPDRASKGDGAGRFPSWCWAATRSRLMCSRDWSRDRSR